MSRRIWLQLSIFALVAVTVTVVMAVGFVRLPTLLFGVGHYQVKLRLPDAAGLYPRANVTYRGTEVGQVKDVALTDHGAEATLSLKSDYKVPSNLIAEIHSQSAVGEQYVALLPDDATSPSLKDGDVIAQDRTRIPPDINPLLDATNRGLLAIPQDNLHTVVDESATAIGGLGPELRRIVKGSTTLAIDAHKNLDQMTNLIDNLPPVLDSQTATADEIKSWTGHLADVTQQLKSNNSAVETVLSDGPGFFGAAHNLVDRLKPTLPVLMANLTAIGPVLVTYRDSLEQLLVLLPQGTGDMQAIGVANRNTKQDYKGFFLDFNLNVNLPPPCTTGFLPTQQMRTPSEVDEPDRPAGDLYCRIPQDAAFGVRGARNTPCVTRPGKRAPTVKMCESDEIYRPLNDGYNWKGDPNATLSGQDIPQLPPPPAAAPTPPAQAPPPIAAVPYDPATGTYIGPDGRTYRQSNLAPGAGGEHTWQSMLLPPGQS